MIQEGYAAELYQIDRQRAVQDRVVPNRDTHFLPFVNPPNSAPLFTVLALAPYSVASRIWPFVRILLLALYVLLVWKWMKATTVERWVAITTLSANSGTNPVGIVA